MNENSQHRIEQALVQFVTEFNSESRYSEFPIVAFQFVSLDDVIDGKMVWWNYLHQNVVERYMEALTKFTGKVSPEGKIKNTLINWEFEDGSFMYYDFNNKDRQQIIPSFSQADFSPITKNIDKSGVEREPAIRSEKIKLLRKWKDLLGKIFCNAGSTMWVSIPHKDESGASIVYSSVFCLFNKPLLENCQLPVARRIRNFIIDYLIDLYRYPLLEQKKALENTVTDFAQKRDITAADYKPKIYAIQYNKPSSDKVLKVTELETHYFSSEQYLPSFLSEYTKAMNRIKETYDPGLKQFNQENKSYPKASDYIIVRNMSVLSEEQFRKFLYGRFLVLAYHVVFEKNAHQTHDLVFDTAPDWQSDKLDIADQINSRFIIYGLRNDKKTGVMYETKSLVENIIPNISKAEFDFLIEICTFYSFEKMKNLITKARKYNFLN